MLKWTGLQQISACFIQSWWLSVSAIRKNLDFFLSLSTIKRCKILIIGADVWMMYFHLLEHYNCWSSIMYVSSSTSTTNLLELFQNNTSLICKTKYYRLMLPISSCSRSFPVLTFWPTRTSLAEQLRLTAVYNKFLESWRSCCTPLSFQTPAVMHKHTVTFLCHCGNLSGNHSDRQNRGGK